MFRIYGLKCNGMKNPRGITEKEIYLTWKLQSDVRGDRQKGYRIQIGDEERQLVWDSQYVESGAVFARFDGNGKLQSHTRYLWKVWIYFNGSEEPVSGSAYFTTGNLENRWSARWVEASQERKPVSDCLEMWKIYAGIVTSSPDPEKFLNPVVCMRKEFCIGKKVKKAYLYGTAHGIYQLRIDGQVASEPLAPGYTVYSKYLEVQQYDVTELLGKGRHVLGALLADGWYTGKIGLPGVGNQYGETNALFAQMLIYYEDGTEEILGTDSTFVWHEAPQEYADLIVGERYRQGFLDEQWMYPDYDCTDWEPVDIKKYSTDHFQGRKAEPVSVVRKQNPEKIFRTPAGELVLDVGENIVGFLNITFQTSPGMVLKMTHSEVLDREGNFLMNILGQNKNQMDVYVCDRKDVVSWHPDFTFHGFRYVKLEGIAEEQIRQIEICILATDLDRAGYFSCSDTRLNRLQENIYRSQQGNMLSIPTDCPQRERAGWLGDMQVYVPTAVYNMDVYSFLRKWLENIRLEQLADGQIPNIVPSAPSDSMIGNSGSDQICSAGWGDASVIIPYTLYRKYGDVRILKENFSMMEAWLGYIEQQASTCFLKPEEEYTAEELERQKYLWNTGFHFGDWLYPSAMENGMTNPVETALRTKEYAAPLMFAYTAKLMAEICSALGNGKEMHYRTLNKQIRKAYAEEYINEKGELPVELQGIYVLALYMEAYPDELRGKGIQKLVELIHKNGNCLDTGFLSVGFLLDTLWDAGEKKLVWDLIYQEKCPSWLYEVKMGATTIWESWNAILPDGTRTNSSYNHFAYGCVGDFLYRKILGLMEMEAGYKEVMISPDLSCGLVEARGTYDSMYGKISIEWRRKVDDLEVHVILPPGVTGQVSIMDQIVNIESGSWNLNFPLVYENETALKIS